jgi:hypothetical protein
MLINAKIINLTLPLATTLINEAGCVVEGSEHQIDAIRCAICSMDVAACSIDFVC